MERKELIEEINDNDLVEEFCRYLLIDVMNQCDDILGKPEEVLTIFTLLRQADNEDAASMVLEYLLDVESLDLYIAKFIETQRSLSILREAVDHESSGNLLN